MSDMVEISVKVSPVLTNLVDKLPAELVDTIIPETMKKIIPIGKQSYRRHLPDSRRDNTRKKQTAAVRARFPYKMKAQATGKIIVDDQGSLLIMGVGKKGAHVNFDHGEKARGKGREHKLWFRPSHKKWSQGKGQPASDSPKFRKQTKDVAWLVQRDIGDWGAELIARRIVKAVEKYAQKGSAK